MISDAPLLPIRKTFEYYLLMKFNISLNLAVFGCGLAIGLLLNRVFNRRRALPTKKRLADLVGNTPMIYLQSLSKLCGCEIYVRSKYNSKAKVEFMNPTGSMKDRTALSIIRGAIRYCLSSTNLVGTICHRSSLGSMKEHQGALGSA
jgi:hypothetical protein